MFAITGTEIASVHQCTHRINADNGSNDSNHAGVFSRIIRLGLQSSEVSSILWLQKKHPHFLTFTLNQSFCVLYQSEILLIQQREFSVFGTLVPSSKTTNREQCWYDKGKLTDVDRCCSRRLLPLYRWRKLTGEMLSTGAWQDGWVGSPIWNPSDLAAGQT